jgi:hypothetical protein
VGGGGGGGERLSRDIISPILILTPSFPASNFTTEKKKGKEKNQLVQKNYLEFCNEKPPTNSIVKIEKINP